jgi:uncharacterized delta-60 repeat protein
MKKIITTLTCLITLNITLIFAQPGTLDLAFNSTGKVTTTIGTASAVRAIAVQTDGKIIAVGYTQGSNKDFAVARYTSAGVLDATFGTAGKITTDIAGADDQANAVAIQSDGKIVVVGQSVLGGVTDFALVRYTTAGALDATFGTSGIAYTQISTNVLNIANAVVITSTGRIIVGGGSDGSFSLAAYKTTGALDSWGSGGKTITNFSGAATCTSLVLQTDGKIIAGGYTKNTSTDFDFQVARYTTGGFLDNTYGTSGSVQKDVGGFADQIKSISLQTDGKVIAAGYSNNSSAISQFALIRINTHGTVDATYGASGIASANFGSTTSSSNGNGVAVLATGKAVAVGSAPANSGDFGLGQFDTSGANDNSFGVGGTVTTDFAAGADAANCIALQADGKMVVGGVSGTTFAVARYIGEVVGINELGLTKAVPVIYPNPVKNDAVIEYTLLKDQMLNIGLYDITGKLISSVITNERRTQGMHREQLNLNGSVAAGTYVLTLSNGSESRSVKITKE